MKDIISKNIGSLLRFGLAALSGSGITAAIIPALLTPQVIQNISDHVAGLVVAAAVTGGASLVASMRRNKKIQRLERIVGLPLDEA